MTLNTEIAIAAPDLYRRRYSCGPCLLAARKIRTPARRRGVLGYRDTYEPLFADLWSDEMHRRLTALVVAQRMARFAQRGGAGLADVLISFIPPPSHGSGQRCELRRCAAGAHDPWHARRAQRTAGKPPEDRSRRHQFPGCQAFPA